jgi:hypothetical protein
MENKSKKWRRDGVIGEINRNTRICGKDDQKIVRQGSTSSQKLNLIQNRSLHWSPPVRVNPFSFSTGNRRLFGWHPFEMPGASLLLTHTWHTEYESILIT